MEFGFEPVYAIIGFGCGLLSFHTPVLAVFFAVLLFMATTYIDVEQTCQEAETRRRTEEWQHKHGRSHTLDEGE